MGYSELAQIAGLLFGALALSAAFRKWVEDKFTTEQKERNVQIGVALGKIESAEKAAAEYRLYVAETYATKRGVTEATDRLMKAFESVGNRLDDRLDAMNQRLDRVIEGRDHRD